VRTRIIEARSPAGNYGRFLLARMHQEWNVQSEVFDGPVLFNTGYGPKHLWVLDLVTGEGACFLPGGLAAADLEKHRIWVCPLFEPFLVWLYEQDLADLDELPEVVEVDAPLQLRGYRRPGPDESRWLEAVDEVRTGYEDDSPESEAVRTSIRRLLYLADESRPR
jgi:hypothetical protein